MNKVILIGRLGKDPELRYTAAGTAVCSFPLATSEVFTKNGERQEVTDWHNIIAWGPKAEAASKYLSKGAQLGLVGKTRTRNYDDRDGNKRYITEVHVDEMDFLARASGDSQADNQSQANNRSQADNESSGPSFNPDDDIPF